MRISRFAALFGATAATIAVAAISLGFERDLTEARARTQRGAQVADTACGPIEFATAGTGPRTVFVAHGSGGGFDQGMALADWFVPAGFRVIAPSRFGYLGTPLPADASPEAQADAFACLLDALSIDRVAILGASAGAMSTMQFALRHPDRTEAMLLLVPMAYAPKPEGEPPTVTPKWTQAVFDTALRSDFLFWAAIRAAPGLLTESVLATPAAVAAAAAPEEQARAKAMLDAILPIRERRLGLVNDAAQANAIHRYELERIRTPTLVITVADDLFGTFDNGEYTAEQIPGAQFIGYADGGHVWLGHHAEIGGEFVQFLRRLGTAAVARADGN